MRKTAGDRIFDVANYTFLIILAFITLYPFIYTASLSLSTRAEAIQPGFHLYPKTINIAAYRILWDTSYMSTGYLNTILRVAIAVPTVILMTSFAAYPLTKEYLAGRKVISFLILFTMLFGGGLIPNYLLIKQLNLMNTVWALVLPGMTSAFNIIVVRNFYKSIPASLEESAKIDGANDFIVLFRIIMPLSMPVLATVALWTAVGNWNAWFDAMIYINDQKKQVLQMVLRQFVYNETMLPEAQQAMNEYNQSLVSPATIRSAAIISTIVPIVVVYPFLQKYFVKGIMLGAVKG